MNGFSDAERERLGKLVEELGESGQCAGKILVHGYTSEFDGVTYNNRGDLEREVGDVLGVIDLMVAAGDLDREKLEEHRHKKRQKVSRYLHFQPPEVTKILEAMVFEN